MKNDILVEKTNVEKQDRVTKLKTNIVETVLIDGTNLEEKMIQNK